MQSLNSGGSPTFLPMGRDRHGNLNGKLSRGQRRLKGRYKKVKRKPIMVELYYSARGVWKTWIHPTKGKRSEWCKD